jgi:hypothetical protein
MRTDNDYEQWIGKNNEVITAYFKVLGWDSNLKSPEYEAGMLTSILEMS